MDNPNFSAIDREIEELEVRIGQMLNKTIVHVGIPVNAFKLQNAFSYLTNQNRPKATTRLA